MENTDSSNEYPTKIEFNSLFFNTNLKKNQCDIFTIYENEKLISDNCFEDTLNFWKIIKRNINLLFI